MAKRVGQALGWCWRFCGVFLALQLTGVLANAVAAVEHHPREGSIVVGSLLLLMVSWTALFWRRGGQLVAPRLPRMLALLWLPLRTLLEAVALTFFAVGVAVVLLQLFGSPAAQLSMRHVSFAHHLTTESAIWSVLANWTLHSSSAALIFGIGLRIDDGLRRLTGVQAPRSPRLP